MGDRPRFRRVGVGPNLAASPRGTSGEFRGLRKTIFKKNCKISKIDFEALFKLVNAFKFLDKEFIDKRIKVSQIDDLMPSCRF